MQTIQELFGQFMGFCDKLHVNFMYVLLWVAAGYIQTVYFPIVKIHKIEINAVWKTFVLGSFFSIVYVLLLRDYGQKSAWVEFAASYVFATSLYEMFIKDIVNKVINWIRGFVNKKLDEAKP